MQFILVEYTLYGLVPIKLLNQSYGAVDFHAVFYCHSMMGYGSHGYYPQWNLKERPPTCEEPLKGETMVKDSM